MRAIKSLQVISLCAAAMFVTASAACTPTGQAGQAGGGLELVKNKCTVCHTMDRINAANHDLAAWQGTIARMRGKGAAVSDAEAAQIADYLSKSGASK
ncbi:MAG: hypothetical protein WCJ13_07070 [Coriobacteriia bacterium]